MLASAKKIHGIISEQMDKGISSERIVLGGFSQGGAIALLVLSLHPSSCWPCSDQKFL